MQLKEKKNIADRSGVDDFFFFDWQLRPSTFDAIIVIFRCLLLENAEETIETRRLASKQHGNLCETRMRKQRLLVLFCSQGANLENEHSNSQPDAPGGLFNFFEKNKLLFIFFSSASRIYKRSAWLTNAVTFSFIGRWVTREKKKPGPLFFVCVEK